MGMRVAMVVLDGFPNAAVDPILTPTLHLLAVTGGRSRLGGIAEATAATYPNHATFVAGRSTIDHGLMANKVWCGGRWMDAAAIGPSKPTIFDACRAEGRSSVAVVGDPNLIGVCGAAVADIDWPPAGEIPDGTPRSADGYLPDAEVVQVLTDLELDEIDFLFVQLDEVDGVRHRHGAWSAESEEQCRRTDAALDRVVDLLGRRWDDTILIVVSDHDHEEVGPQDPVDLSRRLPDGVEVCHQGTAALIIGPMSRAELAALPAVVGFASLDSEHHVVWGEPGQVFGSTSDHRGNHGSPRTATQPAVVAGGHPAVGPLARSVERSRPGAAAWAGSVAELLNLKWRPVQANHDWEAASRCAIADTRTTFPRSSSAVNSIVVESPCPE